MILEESLSRRSDKIFVQEPPLRASCKRQAPQVQVIFIHARTYLQVKDLNEDFFQFHQVLYKIFSQAPPRDHARTPYLEDSPGDLQDLQGPCKIVKKRPAGEDPTRYSYKNLLRASQKIFYTSVSKIGRDSHCKDLLARISQGSPQDLL